MERRCDTCAKRHTWKYGGEVKERCMVLLEMIGKDRDCFAWTDDPCWKTEVKRQVDEYKLRKNE